MGGVIAVIVFMISVAVCGTTSDKLESKGYTQPDSAITAFQEAWIAPDKPATEQGK